MDDDPNSYYVKGVSDSSTQMGRCYDALKQGNTSKPNGVDADIWTEASSAYRQAQSKREGQDYIKADNSVYLITDGSILKRRVTPWLNCLRYLNGGSAPGLQSHFFVQSMPHMMSQYKAILGLSGSLGSESESKFLQETYR